MSENMVEKFKRNLSSKHFSSKNVTAMILFGAIILVFVFFGLPGKLGAGVGSVARVNNSLISLSDFQQAETQIMQYYQSLMGGAVDLGSQRQFLRQQALENLIRNELVSQSAQKEGILATDMEIRDYIVNDIPFLQQDGKFEKDYYLRYLEATHSSAGSFETKLRKEVLNLRIRHLFEIVSSPSVLEVKKTEQLHSHKMNISFVKIDQEALAKLIGKEKSDALLKGLDEALNRGDEVTVNSKLNEIRAHWEETGLVDFAAESLPKISSAVAKDSVSELSKSQPLIKHLVRDGNMKYILKLKEFKTTEASPVDSKNLEMMQKIHANGLYEVWLNQIRAQAQIKMNTQVLQM